MSIAAMNWAMTAAAVESAQEHIILIALADRANDDGTAAWPSQDWIAQRARCSTRTVRRHLKALEERGLIDRGDQSLAGHLRADSRPVVWNLAIGSGQAVDNPVHDDRTTVSGRSLVDARPDTVVRSGRTLLSYKPSLEPPSDTPTPPTPRSSADRYKPSPRHTVVVDHPHKFTTLADACRSRGLTARWDRLRPEQEHAITALIDTHGIPALADAAERAHRPTDPTRFAQGYLETWTAMPPPPRKVPPRPSCGACDEYGWLPDDEDGRAVRCACRLVAAA